MIEIRALTKRYGAAVVVDDVTLTVPNSGVTALIGPNGAGKSTLLGMIGRLVPISSGTIAVDGLDVAQTADDEIARRLAVLRQSQHVAARLTVRDLVAFGRYPHSKGRLSAADEGHVTRALGLLELDDLADRFIDELSGGQRQRASIAMVLCQDSHYVLLDEPLNNLDLKHGRATMQLVRRLADEFGKSLLVVLHDINVAAAYADHIVAMRAGRIVRQGAADVVVTTEALAAIFDAEVEVAEIAGRRFALCI